ncbi:LCP family protein [Trichocoleus desertorum]|uniref:LCP family protein n=1 Tax=Trichocoleus desertorum GB2-A4 TaxID=2933944 RepID=A0ABV0JBF5_9CYAN|nr:LCP family protein [Trichocoleus sp. FACHB-46]
MSTQKIPYQRSLPKRHQPVPKKPTKSSNSRLVWLLFSLTGVAMLSATAGALLAVSLATTPLMQSKLSAEEAAVFGQGESISSNPNFRLPQLTRPVSILILGAKVLSTDVQNPPAYARNLGYQATINSLDGLTDTMLLVRFDPDSKKLAVLSIPRDTRAYVEGYGVTKINEANYYGGPALSAKATSELLDGVGIDRYVRINVQGIEKLIDALGGVTVYIPKDMKYQDDSQHLYINLKAGKRRLNGNQALQFLRFRYDENGDIGRIQRQQMLMRALMEQALNPVTLARVPKILSVIQSHLDTNLSVEELMALVGFATQTNRSNVKMLMVPGDFSAPGEFQASYWVPDQDRIQSLMAQHFNLGVGSALPTNPAYLRVAIQDSTRESAATEGVMSALNQAGYENVSVNDPWTEPLNVTRIVAQQGDAESAEALRQVLGVGEVRIESTGALQSDVTIQVGKDWLRQQSR